MRIVYIGQFRIPNKDAAAARVLNVGRALRLAGHNVRYISWGGEQRKEDLCEDGKFRVDGFEYEVTNELDPKGGLLNKVYQKLIRGRKTKDLLRKRLGEYDVIITYNGTLTRWLLGFSKKNKLKLINDITEWYDANELKITDRLAYTLNMKKLQQKVRNKIVISSYLDNYYNKTHNIIVPATCDASEKKWHHGEGLAKKKVGDFEGVTLIYAGNPARKDAVHYAINAVQRLIDENVLIRFLIVGITREAYIQKYSDLLAEKPLSNRIQFVGRIPQDEVPSYYTLADFMVLLREQTRKSNAGFPTKFSESFTSGTPVIANLTSDLGRYLLDGETGFVVSEPREEAIYRVLKDKVVGMSRQEIETMKKQVRETATQLDYRAYAEPISVFLNELA